MKAIYTSTEDDAKNNYIKYSSVYSNNTIANGCSQDNYTVDKRFIKPIVIIMTK